MDYARPDVLQAAALQIRFFWDLTMDGMVEICRRFGTADFIFRANADGNFLKNINNLSEYTASHPRGR